MGCCLPCFRSVEYRPIPDSVIDIPVTPNIELQQYTSVTPIKNESPAKSLTPIKPTTPVIEEREITPTVFHSVLDENDRKLAEKQYDEDLPVFKGCVVEQKFSNKSSYDTKFAWINIEARSLNLSEHMTKERRHKEASLVDVVSVSAGPPEKFKSTVSANGTPVEFKESHLCLSVKFVRGGGIDLKFKTEEDRDSWHDVITMIVLQQKEGDTPVKEK